MNSEIYDRINARGLDIYAPIITNQNNNYQTNQFNNNYKKKKNIINVPEYREIKKKNKEYSEGSDKWILERNNIYVPGMDAWDFNNLTYGYLIPEISHGKYVGFIDGTRILVDAFTKKVTQKQRKSGKHGKKTVKSYSYAASMTGQRLLSKKKKNNNKKRKSGKYSEMDSARGIYQDILNSNNNDIINFNDYLSSDFMLLAAFQENDYIQNKKEKKVNNQLIIPYTLNGKCYTIFWVATTYQKNLINKLGGFTYPSQNQINTFNFKNKDIINIINSNQPESDEDESDTNSISSEEYDEEDNMALLDDDLNNKYNLNNNYDDDFDFESDNDEPDENNDDSEELVFNYDPSLSVKDKLVLFLKRIVPTKEKKASDYSDIYTEMDDADLDIDEI